MFRNISSVQAMAKKQNEKQHKRKRKPKSMKEK